MSFTPSSWGLACCDWKLECASRSSVCVHVGRLMFAAGEMAVNIFLGATSVPHLKKSEKKQDWKKEKVFRGEFGGKALGKSSQRSSRYSERRILLSFLQAAREERRGKFVFQNERFLIWKVMICLRTENSIYHHRWFAQFVWLKDGGVLSTTFPGAEEKEEWNLI